MIKKQNKILLLIGPLCFILCYILLPSTIFTTGASKAAVGTVVWMAFWWVTAPVDYAVTAFLPIAVNALISICDMSMVIENYASETILLLLGASILTVSWEEVGLDKRFATIFLGLVGDNFRTQLVFWFILSTILSAILPNAVVCATITPIALSMLKYVGEGDITHSRIGSKLLLDIVYATGIGGLISPLGGAMNLVTVNYLQKITGEEYMYTSWVIRFLPITIILVLSNIIFILRDVKKDESLGGSKEYFREAYKKMSKISFEEKIFSILFIVATVLSFTRQLYQNILPGLKPAYVFIICSILSFLITRKDGKPIMIWKSVQTKIIWELLFIFAGGLAAGTLINQSGVSTIIGDLVSSMGLTGGITTVFIIITVTVILSDVTSNTATAAVMMPIIISAIQGIGMNVIPFVYIASVGVNISYMLPTSIRAIPIGYGLSPKYMLKEGWKLTTIVIILMTILCYLMLKYWNIFSTA